METKKPPYRPTIYTDKIAVRICKRISSGESLRKICKDKNMPARKTIHLWLLDKRYIDFLHQYNISCDIRADELFDELNDISDISDNKESPSRSRLRVDTRKWYLSKVMPKKYGDKLDVTTAGQPIQQVTGMIIQKDNGDKVFNKE